MDDSEWGKKLGIRNGNKYSKWHKDLKRIWKWKGGGVKMAHLGIQNEKEKQKMAQLWIQNDTIRYS